MTDSASPTVAGAFSLVKKTCTKCGVEKLLEEFYPKRRAKFGRTGRCRPCICAHIRARQQRPEAKERRRTYQQRPEVKARARAYYQRPEVKARGRTRQQRPEYKAWSRTHLQRPEIKARRRTYDRAYYQRPDVKARKRAYQQRPEFMAHKLDHLKLRRKTDPTYRLTINLRARLQKALKGLSKSARTLGLIGCDIGFLRRWLEAKFLPGMTWENYGEWHVDHIIPCASFDLSDPVQQRTCFRWTNLQPLWAADNLSKSDNTPCLN